MEILWSYSFIETIMENAWVALSGGRHQGLVLLLCFHLILVIEITIN